MNKIIEKIHRLSNAMLKELMASLIAVAIVTTGAIFIYAALTGGGSTGKTGTRSSWAPGGPPQAAPGVGNVAIYWDEKTNTRQKTTADIYHNGNVEIDGSVTAKNLCLVGTTAPDCVSKWSEIKPAAGSVVGGGERHVDGNGGDNCASAWGQAECVCNHSIPDSMQSYAQRSASNYANACVSSSSEGAVILKCPTGSTSRLTGIKSGTERADSSDYGKTYANTEYYLCIVD